MIRAAILAVLCSLLCACMDPTYVVGNGPTASLTIRPPQGLSLGMAASRVVVVYAYQDVAACRNVARLVTFPHEQTGEKRIPSGAEFPLLVHIFDRNTTCDLIGGFTPLADHHYIAQVSEKPPSVSSRLKTALFGGETDGSCSVEFTEQLANGETRPMPYFIMAAEPVAGNDIATCNRQQRVDFDALPAAGYR